MKRKIIAAFVLALVIAGGVAAVYYVRDRGVPNGMVFVSGNIEATEVDLSFRLSGQIKVLAVAEGDRISEGTVVAKLDTDTLEAMKGSADSEIGAARAALDELEEGTRKEEIDMARALMELARSRQKNAKDEYERYFPLFKQGAISQSQMDTRETTLRVATEEYNNAAHRLLELERGPREQVIRAARNRLERAGFELKRIELDMEHSMLYTPVSGVVLTKANELGEVVLPGAPVLTVAAIDEVWLKGYVAESQLGMVKLGQKAEITTDTYPGKVYPGTVTFISSRAEFTPKNVQTREERIKQVYRIKITIKNPHQELKIGMPAEGHILVDAQQTTRPAGGKDRGKSTP